MTPTVVISEFMEEGAVEQIRRDHSVLYDPALVDRPDDLRQSLAAARALIVRNRTQVRAELLAAAPQLSVVGRLGVGLDNIDQAACAERGVRVIPATGANADAVAEYVVLSVGLLWRGAFLSSAAVAAGEWPRAKLSSGHEMAGRRLGIVGFGDIGRRVARLARALGMRVAAHDPVLPPGDPAWAEAERLELDALLEECDAISLHVPLTPGTRHLISSERIARMRPGAVLVNTARGGVVDEAALVQALRDGRLGGAALDVFETEPLPSLSDFGPLAGAPNLILTPHIAGVTTESNVRVSGMIAERVLAALAEGRT